MEDYLPEAWAALPTESLRDYAWNRRPAKITGGYGIFGDGKTTSPLQASDPMMVIDGNDVLLQNDFFTLTKPFQLQTSRAVMLRYTRICSPLSADEAPADYIYRATIECRLGFLQSTASTVKTLKWALEYSAGGAMSLRTTARKA